MGLIFMIIIVIFIQVANKVNVKFIPFLPQALVVVVHILASKSNSKTNWHVTTKVIVNTK